MRGIGFLDHSRNTTRIVCAGLAVLVLSWILNSWRFGLGQVQIDV